MEDSLRCAIVDAVEDSMTAAGASTITELEWWIIGLVGFALRNCITHIMHVTPLPVVAGHEQSDTEILAVETIVNCN